MDGNGQVSYNEFLAATLSAANIAKEENLIKAFEHFDTDNSGFISREELKEALTAYGGVEDLEALLSQLESVDQLYRIVFLDQVDRDNNGQIDYEEFRQLMLGY